MKNVVLLCTVVAFIGGLILSVSSGNFIMLAVTLGFNFIGLGVSYFGAKLAFAGEEVVETKEEEDYSSYRKAHSL